jgi:hypothetical protein
MKKIPILSSLLILFLCAIAQFSYGDLILQRNRVTVGSNNPLNNMSGFQSGGMGGEYSGTAFPAVGQFYLANNNGAAENVFARLDYSYTQDANVAQISFDFEHRSFRHFIQNDMTVRPSGGVMNVIINDSPIKRGFTVTEPSRYELSSHFFTSFLNNTNFGRQIATLAISFREQNPDGTNTRDLFYHFQNVDFIGGSRNLEFTAGVLSGSQFESLQGSLTGDLVPGKIYTLNVNMGSEIREGGAEGTLITGNGQFNLRITAVPEPSSLCMALLAASGMSYRLVQQRRKQVHPYASCPS